jgi:uncharacterized RDD family membrane protein YckC
METNERYKTFWPRFGAAFLDSAALAPLLWIDKVLWNFTDSSILLFLWVLIYQGITLAYNVGFLYLFGQTPGKMAAGVIILDNSDQKLTLNQAILRNIVTVILAPIFIAIVASNLTVGLLVNRGLGDARLFMWFVGIAVAWGVIEFITMLFNSKRRAVHDFIVGTVVVRQPVEERIPSYLTIRGVLIVLLVLNAITPNYIIDLNMRF